MGAVIQEQAQTPAPGQRDASGRGDAPGPGATRASIGRALAEQRVMRGLTLTELAALTRIPLRALERLEQGALDATTDGATRGLVRVVAAAIGLDPDRTVLQMLKDAQPGPDAVSAPSPRRLTRISPALPLLLLVLLAGLALLWWTPRGFERAEAVTPPDVLRRHDAVRALAEELRLRSSDAPKRPVRPQPVDRRLVLDEPKRPAQPPPVDRRRQNAAPAGAPPATKARPAADSDRALAD